MTVFYKTIVKPWLDANKESVEYYLDNEEWDIEDVPFKFTDVDSDRSQEDNGYATVLVELGDSKCYVYINQWEYWEVKPQQVTRTEYVSV